MSRRARDLRVALLAFVLLLVALRVALPFATERLLEALISDMLDVRLEIGAVDLGLLEGEVVAHSVRMQTAASDEELARAGRIVLDIAWGALVVGGLEAERLAIQEPELLVAFDAEGRLNWDAVGGKEEEPDGEPEPAGRFDVMVRRLEIGAGQLKLVDELEDGLPTLTLAFGALVLEDAEIGRPEPGGPLRWSLASADASDWRLGVVPGQGQDFELDIRASTGSLGPDGTIPIGLHLHREDGLTFEIDGVLRPTPLELSLDLDWRDLSSRALLGFLELPGVRALRGESEAKLDLELTLADVPERGLTLRGQLTHRDLALELEGDVSARLDVDRVVIDLDELYLPIPAAPVESPPPVVLHWSRIEVEAPTLDVAVPARKPGTEAAEARSSPEQEQSQLFPLDARVDQLTLRGGRVTWSDPERDADLDLSIGAFELAGAGIVLSSQDDELRWALDSVAASDWKLRATPRDGGEAFDYTLTASTGAVLQGGAIPVELAVGRVKGVQIEAKGELLPDPLEARLALRWSDLQSPYLALLLGLDGVRVERGVTDGTAEIALTLADGPERGLRISGELSHRDLALEVEGDTGVRVEVARLVGVLDELLVPMPVENAPESGPPVLLHVGRMEIHEPAVVLTLPDPAQRDGAHEPATIESGASARDSEAGLEVRVDSLALHRGRVAWRDPAVVGAKEQRLSSIEIEASAIRWPEASARSATVVVGSLGAPPLRVEGSFSPTRADVAMRGSQIELEPWNPLISSYSEYSVSSGVISIRGELALRGKVYEAPIHLTTHHLELSSTGSEFQQNFGVPLSVALGLLTDTAGNIRLALPLSGRLDERTELDLATTIVAGVNEAIVNALANVAALPVDLVGAVFRRVGEAFVLGIGEVQFAPGTYALALDDEIALRSAAQLATKTPQARLVLRPGVVSDDLRALGDAGGDYDALGELVAFGRAIFGGGRSLDPDEHRPVAELSQRRVDAMARFLRDETELGRDRIVEEEWDGEVLEGMPRVVMRLRVPGK